MMLDSDEATGWRTRSVGPQERKTRPGRTLTMALIAAGATVLLSLALADAVVSHVPESIAKNAPPADSSSTLFYHASHEQVLRRSSDGGIYLNADVNERALRFRVDPAASAILLTPSDARAAGLSEGSLTYSGRAKTSAGEVRTAPVTIQYLHFGTLTLFNVPAAVADTSLPDSILGKDFLKRFQSFEQRSGELVLRW
jgi:clan AA aspartic protease (TIGR02281 family)